MSTDPNTQSQETEKKSANPTVKTTDERYLARLNFNPELRKSWLNFFVSNVRVVILLILIITSAGLYSFFSLPRESNPEVKIPIAVITTVYPGAAPADVEDLVTEKLETSISGIEGIDTMTSESANSLSSITVQFDANQDLDSSVRDVRDKVTEAEPNLPTDAKTPTVTEVSLDDQPIITLVLTGPYDGFTLRNYADTLQTDLEKISGVREVDVSGGDEKEYQVAYYPDKLLSYGISADQANQAIAATNVVVPDGNFDSTNFVYPVRADARVASAADIGAIPVTSATDGSVVYVRDLANVSATAIKQTVYSRLSIEGSQPQSAVTINVIKRTGSSVIDTVNQVRASANADVSQFPTGIRYDVTTDMAQQINTSFNQLTHDFLLTLILVFGILFVIVGLKEAFVAGLAIPLVFFVTFTSLYLLGISLNFLSLFSLILSLGLLVDDAIVVVSATKQYLRTGKYTPEEAVLLVLNDFKVVLTTTTLTTVWAFLPLLFATGIIGQYIKSIPVTVSITLVSSLLIALMVNHPLAAVLERIRLTRPIFYSLETLLLVLGGVFLFFGGVVLYVLAAIMFIGLFFMARWYGGQGRRELTANGILVKQESADDELIKKKLREQGDHHSGTFGDRLVHGILHFDVLLPVYERSLRRVLLTRRNRNWLIGVTLAIFLFAIALPVFGFVQSEFFPESDADNIYVDIQAPIGTKLSETNIITEGVEQKLLSDKDFDNFSTVVGQPSPLATSTRADTNVASITITLKDVSLRKLKSYQITDQLRSELQNTVGATVQVSQQSGGPPAGAAFDAEIQGDDLTTLSSIAHQLQPKLASIPGVVNVDISLKDAAPQYTFKLDPVKMQENNVNAAYVGSILRMAITGTTVSEVIEGSKEVDIIGTLDPNSIPTLESLQNLQILNLAKQPVYLKDIATISLDPSVNAIERINQHRTVVLSSGASSSTNSNAILAQFKKNINGYKFPSGYSISYGGQNQQNSDSVVSIIQAMVIAILLIAATLIIQFNSFRKALIVLVTIPLALIGVFIGMAIFGVPLSFPGLIGILALFGIVVKNAIILVDKINLNLRSGIPFMESVIDAGKSRLEAIFITSICTILGILPITLSNELWRSLGGAVIFGLSLSSFLTLFIVPALFVVFIGTKEQKEEEDPNAISAHHAGSPAGHTVSENTI